MKITKIWFEFDRWNHCFDVEDCNADVHFELDNGIKWCASFYTYKNLISMSEKNTYTGEMLSGKYFISEKPIFIQEMTKDLIIKVIYDILQTERDLSAVFTQINDQTGSLL